MRLIGNRPPHTWPVKVFWLLVLIHLPAVALIVVTNIVEGTLLSMIEFWLVTIPLYFLSLLLNPLRLISAVIAAYLVWYGMRLDWTPLLIFLFGSSGGHGTFVRGRELKSADQFRQQLAIRRMTLRGGAATPRQLIDSEPTRSQK